LNLPRADMAELLEVISIRAEQAAIAATPSPSTLYHALEHYHPRALEAAARLIDNERARAKIEHFAHDLRDVQVSIDGKRLQALGQAAGPALGRILKALRDAVLDGIVIGPRQEEEYARALIEQEAKSHE
jgi:hypothetical protein